MDFTLALPMCPPERLLPLARLAEECGWDAISLPDSVFYPEHVSAKYPFTSDGERFWPADAPWVDPLVGIPAMAAATERIGFFTNVLKTPLRHPLLVAKAVGSVAALFPGRIGLGVGLSWIPEEFEWLAQDMSTRGRRLDEQIAIIRQLLAGGWAEHHGDHYEFGRLLMEPVPPPAAPVPIYVGGHSDAGLRRAARLGDGWLAAQCTPDDLAEIIGRLHRALDDAGRDPDGFAVKVTPLVAATPDAMAEVAALGVTGVITVPWYFSGGNPNDPADQDDSVRWFAETVIKPLREREESR